MLLLLFLAVLLLTYSNGANDNFKGVATVNRSFSDLTKLMPQGNKNSFGGTNYRFNNLSIDGMATNDVLGFQEPASGAGGTVAAGTPGALAGTQSISIDAIDEMQVVLSPFNVTLGNFTGANINAVTKSGTNCLAGGVQLRPQPDLSRAAAWMPTASRLRATTALSRARARSVVRFHQPRQPAQPRLGPALLRA